MPRFSHLLTVCLALLALGLGVVVWQQRSEIKRLAASTSANRDARIGNGYSPARPRAAAPQTANRPAPVWVGEEGEVLPRFAANPKEPHGSTVARLLDDQEFVRALAMHQEGSLDERFAPLFRRLNLTAEQLAEFKRLLVEKDNALMDVTAVSQKFAGGLPPATMRAGVLAAERDVENAIRASLGNERYAVYEDYMNTLPQRLTVMRLERRLSYTDTPLEPTQAESLVNILAQHPAAASAETRKAVAPAAAQVEPEPVPAVRPPPASVSREAVTQAQAVLAAPQLAALQHIQAEMDAAAVAAERINRVFSTDVPVVGSELNWLQFLLQ